MKRIVLGAVLLLLSFYSSAVDVQISQLTDTPDPVIRGADITYAISLLNATNDTATNVQLAVPLPATTSFVSVDDGDCSHDGGSPGTLNCSFGNITGNGAGGPITTVNLTVRTSASSGAIVTLTATVSTDSIDTDPTNDNETQNTTVQNGADLNITQTDSADPVTAGGIYSYALNVNNIGPNTASDITVTNTLPANVTYQSHTATGWSCSDAGQVITCTLTSLANGVAASPITLNVKVTGAIAGTVTNSVTVAATTSDSNVSNNTSTENTAIISGTDLSISKSVSTPVIENSAATFTLSPRNLGPNNAATVSVSDTLPTDFVFVSATGTGWSCSESTGTVTCTRATYNIGATDDITIQTTAPSNRSNITNTATISSVTNEANSADNTDSVTFSVVADGADLSITKTKTPDPVALNENMLSIIKVTNEGPNSTSGTVTVTDTLDANESYVSSSGTNWSCVHDGSLSGGDVTCEYENSGVPIVLTVSELAADLRITTKAESVGTLTNTACVVDVAGQTDGVNGNDCANASVEATNNTADLSITQTVSTSGGLNKTLEDNESVITYVLTVTNLGADIIYGVGDSANYGVRITNLVPAFFGGVSGIGGTIITTNITGGSQQNFSCSESSGFISCLLDGGQTFANGDTVEVTITTARGLLDGTTFKSSARVATSILADTNPANDTAVITDIIIEPVADIELQSLVITPDPTKAGTDAAYVISYRNNGPSTATNVGVVHDFIPPAGRSYELRSASSSQGTCAALVGNQLTCSIGMLVSGATETITLSVRPNWDVADDAWVLGNTSTISADTPDNSMANNSKSTNLNVARAELDLLVNNVDVTDPVGWTPTPGTFPASLDNVIIYKIDVTNNGPSVATGVELVDLMTPKNGKQVTFMCDDAGQTGCLTASSICNNLGAQVTGPASITTTCTLPTIESTNTSTRYLYFYADSEPDATGDTHTNIATVNSNNEEDGISANDNESETTSVRVMVDVGVAITPSKTPVEINEPFTWNVVVDNNGPGSSADTVLTNVLPAGMELTGTPIPAQGTCTGNAGDTSFTCSLGTVDNGNNTTISVPVKITTYPTGGTTSNPVSVSTFGVDTDGTNDNAVGVVNVVRSSIAGAVFNDQNDDGSIDSSEHGISSVTITLTGTDNSGNSVNESTTTNSDGEYLFENLSSGTNYILTETHPINFSDGLDNASGTVVVNSRTTDVISSIVLSTDTALINYNFGNLGQAFWYDENGNGVKEITETVGVPNVVLTLTGVELVSGKNITFTYTTGSDGTYFFNNLTAGTYTLTETQPTAWKDGGEELGNAGGILSNDSFSNIVLSASQSASGYNFGEEGGSLLGKVYRDVNDNGVAENTEAGIANVSIRLTGTDTDGKLVDLTTQTNSSGEYSFTGLPASNGTGYTVTETQPTLVFDGKDTLGSLGGVLGNDQFTAIPITALSVGTGYNFGEGVNIDSSIAGIVFIDTNDNGLKESSELPLTNITLTLTGTDRLGATYNQAVVTNSNGEYIFSNIVASDATGYTITETQPTDYDDSVESIAGVVITGTTTTDFISNIQLNDNQQLTDYNFAEVYAGRISGTVFIDEDDNGILNTGDSGISGVSLQLLGTDTFGDSVSLNTVTANDGTYSFTQVIPSNASGYQVIQTHPAGYVDSLDSIGNVVITNSDTTDVHTNIVVALQSNLIGYNFGERLRSSLAGIVFHDLNDDGIQDSGEPGIANVTINLTGIDHLGSAVSLSVSTAANGQYTFNNLLASNAQGYQVTEIQPTGYLDGLDSENAIVSASSRLTDTYTLVVAGGTDYVNYHFGELTPSSISGTVYNDLNDDGIQASGEVGIANATVNLSGTDYLGTNVSLTAITNTNGQYSFTNLRASDAQGYQVTEIQPTDYLDGLDSENSVVSASSRLTDTYTLVVAGGTD